MDGKEEITVAYPDLQIRRWSPKKFFSAFVHQFGPKIGGGGGWGVGGPSPRAATELLKQAARHKKF